jgi:hypothetical protein
MNENHPNPPRWAQMLLRALLRPADTESIPGDLLEEYREVRYPSLGRARANVWYIRHMLSMLWQLVWPFVVAIMALRVFSFPFVNFGNPSLLPAPAVSMLDAVILLLAGFCGAQRTGRVRTGLITATVTSLCSFLMFLAYASATTPGLLMAPFEKPFIFIILASLLSIAVAFGLAVGLLGAALGQRLSPARKARLT